MTTPNKPGRPGRPVKLNPSKNVDKQIKFGEITPTDLRDWDGDTLYIRNNTPYKISFDDPRTKIEFSLTGKNGEEPIATLPIEAARNSGLQRMWRKGDITVSTDPDMENELMIAETAANKVEEEKKALQLEYTPVGQDHGVIYSGPVTVGDVNWDGTVSE